jgi:hypothetical protein
MSIRIANNDISVVVRGYAIAPYPVDPPAGKAHDEGEEKGKAKGKSKPAAKPAAKPDQIERENVLVWVELAPGHPKAVGAIWATLVNGTGAFLEIYDRESGRRHRARGLNRRYERLQADSPRLAGRVRPKGLRLIAPEASRIDDYTRPFVVIDWPGLSAKAASDLLAEWDCPGNTNLQAQLERGLPGSTALAAMLELGSPYAMRIAWGEYLLAEAVARGYARPLITGGKAPQGYLIDPAPWPDIISAGIQRGAIALA